MSSTTSTNSALDGERCWAEIDFSALRHNVLALRERAPGVGVLAVVKANAYGHGLPQVTQALAGQVEMFGVANLCEARACESHAGGTPILLLGAALPQERKEAVERGVQVSVSSAEEAAAYAQLAPMAKEGKVRVHLTVDTGMGRMGVWHEEAAATAQAIAVMRGVVLAGLCSHLPSADEDAEFTRGQLTGFAALAAELRGAGHSIVTHIENSAGAIQFPEQAGTMFRAGLTLYGASPIPEFQSQLRPVLTWKTRVILVREVGAGRGISYGRTFITPGPMKIATLAAGYADGVQRQMSGRGACVLIGGRRCPILGRVTMDQIMVDVSAVPGVQVGDEAVLIGKQGEETILAAEVARWAGTIPWHIFTGLGMRVVRCYRE